MKSYLNILFIQYLKSPFTYISLILPVILLVGLSQLVPAVVIFPLMISTGYISVSLLLFGGSILEIRKTSFIKSLSLTKINKYSLVFLNVLIALFFMFILTIFNIFLLNLFSNLGIITSDWSAFGPQEFLKWYNGTFQISNIKWGKLIYAIFSSALLSFLVAFVIISISRTQATLYLFSFTYIIAFWFLTWLVIPSFFPYGKIKQDGEIYDFMIIFRYFIPHYWSATLLTQSLHTSNFYVPADANIPPELIEFWQNNVSGKLNFEEFINILEHMQQWISDHENLPVSPEFVNNLNEFIEFGNFYIDNYVVSVLWKELMVDFGPLILSLLFLIIGIKNFSWSIR